MAILESIAIELKSLRYLINNLITALFDIKQLLALLLAKEEIKEPKKRKRKKNAIGDENAIKFDLFSLTPRQYESLVKEYGYDIVCRAGAMLDDYIRGKGYIPYGNPALALKKCMIIHAMKEKLDEQKVGFVTFKDIDHTLIENKADAIAFINAVPRHIRNVDPSVRELRERFDINGNL